ncbi:RNA-binding protein [Candidatus Aerophobetes bacterium]|nr:RNA-binding protein [Candidatus Aerophobetes bacterium]
MSTKLYVGNLSYKVTEDDLKDLFSEFESVIEIKLIIDRATGRSRGFGFVEFSSREEANKAIAILNKKTVQGRQIIVNEARPQRKDRSGKY